MCCSESSESEETEEAPSESKASVSAKKNSVKVSEPSRRRWIRKQDGDSGSKRDIPLRQSSRPWTSMPFALNTEITSDKL